MNSLLLLNPRRAAIVPEPVSEYNSFWFIPRLAFALGAPVENVQTYWPPLASRIPYDKLVHTAALATISVESGSFRPINEFGGLTQYGGQWYDYFFYMYDPESPDPDRREVAADLGNIYPGDGARFHGRGLIQLTGRGNYTYYGDKLGYDLVNNPELANDPEVAAAVFALFCEERGVWHAAQAQDWRQVRKLVNGGLTGYQLFLSNVSSLLSF